MEREACVDVEYVVSDSIRRGQFQGLLFVNPEASPESLHATRLLNSASPRLCVFCFLSSLKYSVNHKKKRSQNNEGISF
jgi:hypothetical protein